MLIKKPIPYPLVSSYISSTLEAGGMLSQYIFKKLTADRSSLCISSVLPVEFFPNDESAIRSGGLSEKEDIASHIANSINGDVIAILDDVMAGASDIKENEEGIEIYADEKYHIIDSANITTNEIRRKVFASLTPWHQLIVLLQPSTSTNLKPYVKNLLSPLHHGKFLLKEVILGAFDGEGYIHIKFNTQTSQANGNI